jgi:hypothetical protein
MTRDDLAKLVKAEPFVPFEIVLVNDRRILIPHPDFIAVPPDRRSQLVLFYDPEDGLPSHFTPNLVAEVALRPETPPTNGHTDHS